MSGGAVVRGQSITLNARYRLDGVLTDPALPTYVIRDPANVTVASGTPTRDSTGIYHVVFTPSLVAPLDTWQIIWDGVISGQPVGPIPEDFTVLPVGYVIPTPSSSFTYNIDTDVGKVRLLTDDRDMSNATTAVPLEKRSVIFTDEEIGFFITQGGSILMAAALGLRTIANNRSLLVQRRLIGRTDVDYGTLRRDLLAAASAMEETATTGEPADGYAERAYDDFSYRDIIVAEWARRG